MRQAYGVQVVSDVSFMCVSLCEFCTEAMVQGVSGLAVPAFFFTCIVCRHFYVVCSDESFVSVKNIVWWTLGFGSVVCSVLIPRCCGCCGVLGLLLVT